MHCSGPDDLLIYLADHISDARRRSASTSLVDPRVTRGASHFMTDRRSESERIRLPRLRNKCAIAGGITSARMSHFCIASIGTALHYIQSDDSILCHILSHRKMDTPNELWDRRQWHTCRPKTP
jgi:hypothetical protein